MQISKHDWHASVVIRTQEINITSDRMLINPKWFHRCITVYARWSNSISVAYASAHSSTTKSRYHWCQRYDAPCWTSTKSLTTYQFKCGKANPTHMITKKYLLKAWRLKKGYVPNPNTCEELSKLWWDSYSFCWQHLVFLFSALSELSWSYDNWYLWQGGSAD